MNSQLVLSILLSCLVSQSFQLYGAGIGYNAYGIGGIGYPYGAGRGIYGSPTLSPYGAGIPGSHSPGIYGSTYGAGIVRGIYPGGLGGAAYNPDSVSPILSQYGLGGGLGGAGYIPYAVGIPRGPDFSGYRGIIGSPYGTDKSYANPLSSSQDVDTYRSSSFREAKGINNGLNRFLNRGEEEVSYIVDAPFNDKHGAFYK